MKIYIILASFLITTTTISYFTIKDNIRLKNTLKKQQEINIITNNSQTQKEVIKKEYIDKFIIIKDKQQPIDDIQQKEKTKCLFNNFENETNCN